jgi:ATP-dependent DNA helicase RecG
VPHFIRAGVRPQWLVVPYRGHIDPRSYPVEGGSEWRLGPGLDNDQPARGIMFVMDESTIRSGMPFSLDDRTQGRAFDDRRSLQAKLEDISPSLVRRFLHQVRSDILNVAPPVSDYDLYRKLRIVLPINGHEVPRNVALLFFNEDPDRFFPGARIEVVRFRDDAGGDLFDEHVFRGPLPEQIRMTLQQLTIVSGELVRKVPEQAEAERSFAYPIPALEEAVVNAVYHRGYDGPPEPSKVYIYPDRIEIINYPGLVAGVRLEQLQTGHLGPVAPARNRRIGEFFKELRLAEARGTGIPKIRRKMKANGSPEPRFDLDDDRTYYRTTLPIHPEHLE